MQQQSYQAPIVVPSVAPTLLTPPGYTNGTAASMFPSTLSSAAVITPTRNAITSTTASTFINDTISATETSVSAKTEESTVISSTSTEVSSPQSSVTSSPVKKDNESVKEVPSASEPQIIETTSPRNVAPVQKLNEPEYKTKEEAVNVFKQLLEDAGVGIHWDWSTAMKKIINDRRYRALKKVSEKQAVFNQYIEEKKGREREELQGLRKKQREEFIQMLSELVPDINSRTPYRFILPKIQNDERFLTVRSEQDRLDFFDEYQYELGKKERKKQEQKRKEHMGKLKTLLLEKMEEGVITYKTSPRKMEELFQNEEWFQELSKSDCLAVWDDIMPILKRKEDERRESERQNRKKKEEEVKETFRNLLNKLRKEDRKLNVLSHWKEIKPLIKSEPVFNEILEYNTINPRRLFETYLDYLELEYKADKKVIRSILKDLNFSITPETEFDQFYQAVSKDERLKTLDPDNVKILFEEMIHRAKKKEKKKEKYAKRFYDMLYNLGVTTDSTFDQIQSRAKEEKIWRKMKSDDMREELFNEYVRRLKNLDTQKDKDSIKRERLAGSPQDEPESKRARTQDDPIDQATAITSISAEDSPRV
jgi:hypothetical protein